MIEDFLQGLASSDAWVRCPGATKYNVVFSVKEISYQELAVIRSFNIP
jgi:hypothetical protein